eukprot:864425_1
MAQEAVNDHDIDILASLKTNNRGWTIGLFQDQHTLPSFICFECKCVCCEAVELGCDHDDNDIFLYCKSCLTQLIKGNGNKCPIDNHDDPTIIPNRSLRRQISKSMTYCPYSRSSAYKSDHSLSPQNDDNNQIMDTLGGDDQKEGNPQVFSSKSSSSPCQWQGTLNDLIHNHLAACMQRNDSSYSLRIKIKDLQRENAQLKQSITELKNTQNENINETERYKAQTIALQNLIQQKQTTIDELKTEQKQSQMIIQTVNENVTAMQNEVGFQSFKIDKLKQENMELKRNIDQYQSENTQLKNTQKEGNERYIKAQIIALQNQINQKQTNIDQLKTVSPVNEEVELKTQLDITNTNTPNKSKHDAWKQQGFETEWITPPANDAVFPQKGQSVTVHCRGYGKDGDLNKVFWSTKDKNEPVTFQIGLKKVITG